MIIRRSRACVPSRNMSRDESGSSVAARAKSRGNPPLVTDTAAQHFRGEEDLRRPAGQSASPRCHAGWQIGSNMPARTLTPPNHFVIGRSIQTAAKSPRGDRGGYLKPYIAQLNLTETRAGFSRRRSAKPAIANPKIIMAHIAGSGTAATRTSIDEELSPLLLSQ